MGYRVDYGPMNRAMRQNVCRVRGWPVLCALFFLCFLVLVWSFWAEGREVLMKMVFPGDWEAVEGALGAFQEAMADGASPAESVEAFCAEILREASFG